MKKLSIMVGILLLAVTIFASEGYEKKPMFENMKDGDKGAVVMVHFGSSYPETRKLTIDAINEKASKEFKGLEVRDAFTSRIIMRILEKRGIDKNNPKEVLESLKAEGYTHILVQATHVIDGIESENLKKEIEEFEDDFKEIRLGKSLLTSPEDYKEVAHALGERIGKLKRKEAAVFVGHGTHDTATAAYPMMDYMFKSEGYENYYVGTIEGYPTFDDVVARLKDAKIKKVKLMPFMFVAGDHANNDIAVDWKEMLEEKGFKVEVILEGLGQLDKIQTLYMEHARFASENEAEDMAEKKKEYAAGKE
ncbi:sirohydrochlorin cobaltochelatase [uncultured Ilyobacter sp.]|uniref:sirohydrochlorin cobaltochelatase n=1 Tax=uncultured Ilyobacter sp. TaxID=544433 RepID=UPI0029C8FAE8|nr:sirohydrochlorin cobaltochelatase [uncultured Ilyobacter sp.]